MPAEIEAAQTLHKLTGTYLKYGIVPVGKKNALRLGLPVAASAGESTKIEIVFDRGRKVHPVLYDPVTPRFFGVTEWLKMHRAAKGDSVAIETVIPGRRYRFGFVPRPEAARPAPRAELPAAKPARKRRAESVVGAPINYRGLIYAPINEQGVVLLFGMLFEELGMVVEEIKTGFPDATIRRFNGKGWVRSTVEFEYASNNFKLHKHPVEGCDMIVCWRHNWSGCPLEVVELAEFVPLVRKP